MDATKSMIRSALPGWVINADIELKEVIAQPKAEVFSQRKVEAGAGIDYAAIVFVDAGGEPVHAKT
jgi:hypothetical protein